ncbi:MAG: exodeoxyribonuclease VII large subunit [Pseudomonadota bacterium]
MPDDLFSIAEKQPSAEPKKAAPQSNVPELSVSDLANSLKKTLEETYGRIRVRGELSGLKLAASGHLYGDIKDENANINIICWRGTLSKLSIKPEDGMDVLITGKMSSYPKSSRYQIIIDKLELAGEGALLKLLEERKKKLAAEGLFDPARKKSLPLLPERIGIITSPSGAVIRDIMHRLRDRFPRHALIWPVKVQGDGAAEEVAAAINGFNALKENKPDLLIIARGGGSLEDLMAFNEENVVRAIAASNIPVISAVGHETDTTLADYAADVRAPTPTGAAEMAVPVRSQIYAQLQDNHQRLINSLHRLGQESKNRLETRIAKLGSPQNLIDAKIQTIDILSERISSGLQRFIFSKRDAFQTTSNKLQSPVHLIDLKRQKIDSLERMLISLSPKSVLKRGFAIIYDKDGKIAKNSQNIGEGQEITVEFAEKDRLKAVRSG